MKFLRLFIQLARPFFILIAVLLYILGIALSHYLSGPINWNAFILGMIWVIFTLLGSQFLNEYFDPSSLRDERTWKHTPFSGGSGAIGVSRLPRQAALWSGLACLTLSASMTVLILQYSTNTPAVGLILGLIFIGEFTYAIPPLRLVSSGYGELIMSIIRVGLIPALAFLLQGQDFHRLLVMVSFPLTLLHLSMLIAYELPDYASDLQQGKKPILIRIGWQRGMQIHNLLILAGFVILGIAFALGLPLSIGWPVVFVLPVGVYQIWLMNRIADGIKPNWNILLLMATATFGLTAYILAFAFWTH